MEVVVMLVVMMVAVLVVMVVVELCYHIKLLCHAIYSFEEKSSNSSAGITPLSYSKCVSNSKPLHLNSYVKFL